MNESADSTIITETNEHSSSATEVEENSNNVQSRKIRKSVSERFQQIINSSFFSSNNSLEDKDKNVHKRSSISKSLRRLSQSRLIPFTKNSSSSINTNIDNIKSNHNIDVVSLDETLDEEKFCSIDQNLTSDINLNTSDTNSKSMQFNEVKLTTNEISLHVDLALLEKEEGELSELDHDFDSELNTSLPTSTPTKFKKRDSFIVKIMNKFKSKSPSSNNSPTNSIRSNVIHTPPHNPEGNNNTSFYINIKEDRVESDKQFNDIKPEDVKENNIEIIDNVSESSPSPMIIIPKKLYSIVGIRDKVFTEKEILKLSILPQCKHVIPNIIDRFSEYQKEEMDSKSSDIYLSDYILPATFHKKIPDRKMCRFELPSENMSSIDFDEFYIDSRVTETIMLRDNQFKNINELKLQDIFRSLLELDLGHNCLVGHIYYQCLPFSLLRLDLSYNEITDIDGIIACLKLEELNLSHNKIDKITPLPSSLLRLDLSHNLLWNKNCIRMISLSFQLISVSLDFNPLTCLYPKWKTTARCCMTRVRYYDARKLENSNTSTAMQDRSSALKSSMLQRSSLIGSYSKYNTSSSFSSPYNSPMKSSPPTTPSFKEQLKNDELRSGKYQLYLNNIQVKKQQLEVKFRNLASSSPIQISKNEETRLADRLCIPKYISPKRIVSHSTLSTFGCSKRNLIEQSIIYSPTKEYNAVDIGGDGGNDDNMFLIPIEEAIDFIDDWIKNATFISKQALRLIRKTRFIFENQHTDASIYSIEIKKIQNSYAEIPFNICEPLPLKVKLAINTLQNKHLFATDMHMKQQQDKIEILNKLRDKLCKYKSVFQQVEHALLMVLSTHDTTAFNIIHTMLLLIDKDIALDNKLGYERALSVASVLTTDSDNKPHTGLEMLVADDNEYESVEPTDKLESCNFNNNNNDQSNYMIRSELFESLNHIPDDNYAADAISIESDWSGRGNWMGRILLGEAAVLLNTIIDLTATSSSSISSQYVTKKSLETFRNERERLAYSVQLEKYPKAFESLMQNKEVRIKLSCYDQLFTQIDNVMYECVQHPDKMNIKIEIDKIMNSKLGKSINENSFLNYK